MADFKCKSCGVIFCTTQIPNVLKFTCESQTFEKIR